MGRNQGVGLCLGLMLLISPIQAADKDEKELVEQVGRAIDKGVRFLKQQEAGRGHWEHTVAGTRWKGGFTSLALLALLNAGVPPDDPVVQRGLDHLRKIPPADTYVVGLQTMALAEAGLAKDKELIQRNVDWLIEARVESQGRLKGWSYQKGAAFSADNSNTQYALLGLHAGKTAGAKIPDSLWKEVRRFYIDTQRDDGGWDYNRQIQAGSSTLTMTTAGFCGLHIAGLELTEGRQKLQPNGVALQCGRYEENKPLRNALRYIGSTFNLNPRGNKYYNIYGIERAGRLSGQRFLGGHDWYREGCEHLIRVQQPDGSFAADAGGSDSWPVIATSFGLLFLSKGRTPILITKLAYGPENADGWNNKHHDVRRVVEYCSRELFEKRLSRAELMALRIKLPLAWQVYDARQIDVVNDADIRREAGNLLQSPVVFMNGHDDPTLGLRDVQKKILKKYLEEGGFLFAEACCGREAFADGFRKLISELFDRELRPLPDEHPIWRAHQLIPPGRRPRLEGLELGCKTVAILAVEPLAGFYEENLWDAKKHPDSRGPIAFQLAANIVAYATGLEPPRPRLTRVELLDDKDAGKPARRGFLRVGQLRHEGDWQPAPKAMPNLMRHLREKLKLDVTLKPEEVLLHKSNSFRTRFLYMHGRGAFEWHDSEVENLRANLLSGGILLADACCGSERFDEAFREAMKKVFPREKFPKLKLERIPLNDELYSRELNGTAIATVQCRREKTGPGGSVAPLKAVEPFLEGIQIDGRWVVIYSKYDIGCALEKHQASDCLGHDHESALRLASAVVLYALKR